jgi:hypothetical protein
MPANYFQRRDGVTGTLTFRTPLPYASPQLTRFVVGELLLIASAQVLVWVVVTSVTEGDDYMEYQADVKSGVAGTLAPRTTVISFGLPNEGYLIHKTNQGRPYVDVARHEGEPWLESDVTTILRLGWLGDLPLATPGSGWLGALGPGGGTAGHAPNFESTEYGLAIGPNFSGGPWQIYSDVRHHSYRSSHTWATAKKEIGGVDADAVGSELAWWIGSRYDPDFWFAADGTVGISPKMLRGVVAGINTLFTELDGAMLLGPHTTRTSSVWTSTRGHTAALSGAYRLEPGPFPNTQALAVLPEAENLVTNPIFENNVTDFWTSVAGGTATLSSIRPRWGSNCCKLATTGVLTVSLSKVTAIASPAESSYVTYSMWVRTTDKFSIGERIRLSISEVGGAANFWANKDFLLTSEWQRICITHQITQSGLTGLDISVVFGDVDAGVEYCYLDGVNLTQTNQLLPHMDGTLDGVSWAGTAHNSISEVLTATGFDLDNDVDAINNQAKMTITMWVQVPRDSSQGEADMIFMDAQSASSGMDRFKLYFSGSGNYWKIYCQGSERLFIETEEEDTYKFRISEQLFLALAFDFAKNVFVFYVNGLQEGGEMGGIQVFEFDKWRVAGDYNGANQSGLNVGEVGVFHRMLSSGEIRDLYTRRQALVDTGAFA